MSNFYWLTDARMARLQPFFPKSHGKPRVDGLRVLSGIIFINRNGLRWCDAPKEYGRAKTLYNRWKRWSDNGVFARIMVGLPVKAVLTDNGREFCGTEKQPYELYLNLNGIEHRRTKVRAPKTYGFVERFNGTVLDEFFWVKMRETFYETIEALQVDLDPWLIHYNTERPHLGYRNQRADDP